jgi:hypothetical protein
VDADTIRGPLSSHLERLKEIDEILARDTNAELKIEGTYIKAVAKIRLGPGGSPDLSAAEEFIKLAPNDHRCAVLLRMASRSTDDRKKKAALEDRIMRDYPSSEYSKVLIRRRLNSEPDLKAKEALEDRVLTQVPGKIIPVILVVDADGNLFSGDARGKLDTIIPELLERKSAANNEISSLKVK